MSKKKTVETLSANELLLKERLAAFDPLWRDVDNLLDKARTDQIRLEDTKAEIEEKLSVLTKQLAECTDALTFATQQITTLESCIGVLMAHRREISVDGK